MCGRYSLASDHAEIQRLDGYDASVAEWERRDAFVPRYNIAPHTQAPVVRRRSPRNSELVMSSMEWGLIRKLEDRKLNTINARSENLATGGGMWATIKGPKRCAVVCQGYYEWAQGETKVPHFVKRKEKDGRLMLLAGLYNSVVLPGETEPLWTFTIITTAANPSISWLHGRQPVILSTPEALSMWLDTSQIWSQRLARLFNSSNCALDCYPVPKGVGKVGNESPTFIEPIGNLQDGMQAKSSQPQQTVLSLSPADNEEIREKFEPSRTLIYQALISYLKAACTAGVPDRNQSEIAKLQVTLTGYELSMASENIVDVIVESLECRKTLLELSSKLGLANDPKLRTTLRTDEERIAALLVSIFTSDSAEEIVLGLEGDSAQCFLDVVQRMLDKGFLIAAEHTRMAQNSIRKLSALRDKLPSSLFITGLTGKEEHPTFGGGYGDIYRASHNNRLVAMKYMRAVYFMRGEDLRRIRLKFCREALVWKDLHHRHILPFLGIDQTNFPASLCMVSPWMDHGTVLDYLKDYGHTNVDKLLSEIAQGLQYLHSRGIVHGDLRGANVLINEDWSACLADFGLSIFSDATSSMTTNRAGSLYWMAPELIDPDQFGLSFVRTPASDVYAYGCVCFELYTGRPPWANLSEPGALMKVISGERPQRPSGPPPMSDILWERVSTYWMHDPRARPATEVVVQHML